MWVKMQTGFLFCNPDGKRTLRRLRSMLRDNFKMNLREKGWGGVDWIAMAEDGTSEALVEDSCEHSNKPSGSIYYCKIFEWLSDWQLLKKDSIS
jgi:hypothetical protein